MFSHQRSASRWLAVLCTVTFVVLAGLGLGCSEDDIVGDATAEAVEHGLDEVLADTVSPMFQFYGDIPDLVTGGAGRASFGIVCPNTANFCDGGGTATCTVVNNFSEYQFVFDQCNKVSGDLPYTLDGTLLSSPTDVYQLTFQNLFIEDTAPALNGTGSASINNCTFTVNVVTDDASVTGTVVQCDTDNFPQASPASHLSIDDGNVLIDVTFDGSNIANALAYDGKTLVADCNINMANHPATSSCDAP
jgi:hypothetical protein